MDFRRAAKRCEHDLMDGSARQAPGEHGLLPANEQPYSLLEVKRWRALQFDAGRPSGLADYFAAHGICAKCHGQGVHMVGWSDPVNDRERQAAQELDLQQLPLYAVCPDCAGGGKV
jgi:hypothetical protein